VDDPQLAALAPVGTSVLTTIAAGVAAMLERLGDHVRPLADGRALPVAPAASRPMSGAFVMHTIAASMPADAVAVEEAPTHRNAMHDHLPIRTSGGFYCAASGGLGWALPASVGVALARPERRVLCLLGDGSSLYSIQGLWTAVQQELSITFVVLNNHGYGALKALGRAMGIDKPPGVELPGVQLVDLAAGFGCPARQVAEPDELEGALQWALGNDGPALLDVEVDASVERIY
jgi:benzoylformate decarboxylase